jgi:hypothetical protein
VVRKRARRRESSGLLPDPHHRRKNATLRERKTRTELREPAIPSAGPIGQKQDSREITANPARLGHIAG